MRPAPWTRLLLAASLLVTAACSQARDFTLTILHNNDFHSRVEPATVRGETFGGYARVATLFKRFRASEPNPILLNAGDVFQGTLYFNVYEGQADAQLMSRMGIQAMAVGNHEFDKGPAPLAAFARRVNFPLLAANLDVSAEPSLKDRIQPSTILTVGGERIGVVGAITNDTPNIASPGPTVRFLPLESSVQAEVDRLERQGINKIILLTHIGYNEDLELARKIRGADVIIGGHSHTLLGTWNIAGFPQSRGDYPTVVRGPEGNTVLVAQAWEWGKVFGRLRVTFDAAGRVRRWQGSPMAVDKSVPEDPEVARLVEILKRPIAALGNQVIGRTERGISRARVDNGSSIMGEQIADAFLVATRRAGSVAAFINSGGVRADIDAGPITYGEAIGVQPFNNTLVVLDLTGDELLGALRHSRGGLFPSRGTRYTVQGGDVTILEIGGQPFDRTKTYRVTVPSFIAAGGDAHEIIKNAKGYRLDTGLLDIDAFVEFIKANQPLDPAFEGRVKVSN